MEISTVPVHYVVTLLQSAQGKGLNPNTVLASSGIDPQLFGSDKARVATTSFVKLCNYLTAALQDENCGLIQERTKLGTFSMMCNACIHCPDLGSFLQRCYEFNDLVSDCITIELRLDGEMANVILTAEPGTVDESGLMFMVLLSISHRLASWAIGQTIALDTVYIARERPSYAQEYNFLFMAPIAFSSERYGLSFSAKYLDMPVIRQEQDLAEFLSRPSLHMMANPDLDQSLVSKVRAMIKDEVGSKFPEFETIADQLHLTSATLRRRLRAEGSSYQQLKDDIRRDTAIFHLSRGIASMEQVAESVGFSEPTSFFRAFKRWTGVTPRAYIGSKSE